MIENGGDFSHFHVSFTGGVKNGTVGSSAIFGPHDRWNLSKQKLRSHGKVQLLGFVFFWCLFLMDWAGQIIATSAEVNAQVDLLDTWNYIYTLLLNIHFSVST